MNYGKIQEMIIKEAYKRDSKNEKMNIVWDYAKTGSGYIVTDGHFSVVIPNRFCYLKFESIFEKELPQLPNLMNDLQTASEIIFDTDTQKKYEDNWLHIFTNKNDEKIYVNQKALKNFLDGRPLVFRGQGKKSPVLVIEDGILIGCIASVSVVGED